MYKKALAVWIAAASLLSADTLLLRNGNRVDGTFVSGDSRSVRFVAGNQVKSYSIGDVDSIQFGDSNQSSAEPPQVQPQNYPPPPGQAQNTSPANQAQNYPPPQPPGGNGVTGNGPIGVELPSGTSMVIRLIDPVDSDLDHVGQTYRASIDQPVVVDGQTVVPRGTDAVAVLTNAQKGSKLEGRTSLTLDLQSLTLEGRTYDLVTGGVTEASNSRTIRSAKVIGGTAALGAIIGAIAGGGKGAAIGTLAGAGAGTAATIATSGPHVKIPPETRLTFSLTHPLDL